jgi:hypothetical protein
VFFLQSSGLGIFGFGDVAADKHDENRENGFHGVS